MGRMKDFKLERDKQIEQIYRELGDLRCEADYLNNKIYEIEQEIEHKEEELRHVSESTYEDWIADYLFDQYKERKESDDCN